MDRSTGDTGVAPRRPALEQMLFEATARALGVAPIALGIGGSAMRGLRPGGAQDVNLIAVAEGPPPSRLHVAAFNQTVDIMLESPRSLESELNEPRRPRVIRLLAGTQVLCDADDVLLHAVERARQLLDGPPPRSVHPNEMTLSDEIRDGAARLPFERGPMRGPLRGALLERIVNLMYVRTGCWPASLRHAVDVLASHDVELGRRLANALEDDAELHALAKWVLTPVPAGHSARATAETAIAHERSQPKRVASVRDVWSLPPAALARLPIEAAAELDVDDLRRMSKLQVLTVHRVHGAAIGAPEQSYINAMLAG